METLELRKKIIHDFRKFIQDDSKLEILEGIFDSINSENITSIVPYSHYKIVAESRQNYLLGIETSTSLEEMEQRLNEKYGLYD